MPIFCSFLPFCAIFSLIFENFSRFLLPKNGRFSIKNGQENFVNSQEIFFSCPFLKKDPKKHPQKTCVFGR